MLPRQRFHGIWFNRPFSLNCTTTADSSLLAAELSSYPPPVETSELRRKLRAILDVEEGSSVDWARVARLSEALDGELAAGAYAGCPEVVCHFLSDDDIRAGDDAYARRQRQAVRAFVETGEYEQSKPVPWWGCLLLLATAGAAMVWLLG